jgi:hypothetical protein
MSKIIIAFSPSVTGMNISDMTWDWCKKVSNNATVSTGGSTIIERGSGVYILSNPNITEDSDFMIHITDDPDEFVTGVFSLYEGDIARQSYLESLLVIGAPTRPTSQYLGEIKSKDTITSLGSGRTRIIYPDGSQVG